MQFNGELSTIFYMSAKSWRRQTLHHTDTQ
jgi:hypothetical protein